VLENLKRVLREIVGMEVRLEELVLRAVRVCEQIVQHVLFHHRIAADGPGVADEGGDLISLQPLDCRGVSMRWAPLGS